MEVLANNMQEIDNIFKEIGDVNDLFFTKKISENKYKELLKPIYEKLNKAINNARTDNKFIK